MKLVFISDTHGCQPTIPEGDILCVIGDMTHLGTFSEFKKHVLWLKSLSHRHKILVAGNHDIWAENLWRQGLEDRLRQFLRPVIYLRDSDVTIDGIRFYGSPWIPPFAGAFNLSSDELRKKWGLIPACDVLLTHCPPHAILDGGKGCPYLQDTVFKLRPKIHAFGHCHESAGILVRDGTRFLNVANSPRAEEM